MNPKYAVFIWGSYALTALVLVWNAFAPRLRRNDLKRLLSAGAESDSEEQ
ncbi:MAG: heme exporter protein CcmD [Nevskia sp.]|nr:heme exporter protein CcmD [Nevskia sp.]